ncbi:hypothetical protein [Streptomyces sp. NPDC000410]|uniref:hypothetical protein n=1 Tax=Streptomyces sp. NPDC000410 TaxID=3154254 RepID=UPI0033315B63
MDEAQWAVLDDATAIRAHRRLCMTATPRSFSAPDLAESACMFRRRPTRRTGLGELDASANSMVNESVYGKKIHDYPLARAIDDGRAAGGPRSRRPG